MRTKHFILILCCVVVTTIIFIVLGPAGEPNDSLKSIVTHTHQQLNKLQENLRVAEQKKLDIDPKYLAVLGFISSSNSNSISNGNSRSNSSPKKPTDYNRYNTQDNIQHQTNEKEKEKENWNGNGKEKEGDAAGPGAGVGAGAGAGAGAGTSLKTQSINDGVNSVYEIRHLPLQDGSLSHRRSSGTVSSQTKHHNGIPHVTTTPFNGTKANFTIVTYVQDGQAPSAILLSQNIAAKFPNEYLLIYDLGMSEDESRALNAYCNSSKCSVIGYDLSVFPSHVTDQRMHAYRPIVIKDALMRSKSILFAENNMRIRGTSRDLNDLQNKVMVSGVLGWNSPTAVSARTHPKMFDYFQTDAEDFIFLRMVDLDVVLFTDSLYVTEKIMLPWIKCALTLECIDPIGAQSNGCKYNKKPQYRYSGCHSYDTSAFNIVLGLTWHLDVTKYSLPSEAYSNIFYKETLEQATKILENRRRNSSETSEHPFADD